MCGAIVMTQPWPAIIAHYQKQQRGWRSILALETIATFIGESPLAVGLFAWTSMDDLCIVQQDVRYPYNGPLLRLSPVSEDRLEFRYEDTGDKLKQWHRIVDAGDSVPRLLTFLDQLRWFPETMLESLGRGIGRTEGQ
jgi:hypothetical protein